MKIFRLIFLFVSVTFIKAQAQFYIPDTINTSPVTELQTVQTPTNTFITALMVSNTTVIYRSTDYGVTWDSVFSYGADADFNSTPDPVLTVDSVGAVYLVAMRHLPAGGGFTAHLWMFKSLDDGITWNLVSTPYAGSAFADYPSLTSLGDGRTYLSYTHYTFDTTFIRFNRSFDGGITWTDTSTFPGIQSNQWSALGSDLGWGIGNKLYLSYGDYNQNIVYFTSSNDSGLTWLPIKNISVPPSYFNITKVVSSRDYTHLGIIVHQPHYLTDVFYCNSLDSGATWEVQTITNNSAYCEGTFDQAGNVHLIFNRSSPTPGLRYRYSTDQGQTFSTAITLLSWMSVSLTAGEYQSLLLGNDGLFHVTYVDWNEGGAAKHLIFAPLATDIYLVDPSTHAPRIFPNPVHDLLTFESDFTNASASFDLVDMEGRIVRTGTVNVPKSSVNVTSLESGIYVLRVFSGRIVYAQKVLKR